MKKTWKLKRTVQCAKCPWRIDVDPHDIPNGYSVEKHEALEGTIAQDLHFGGELRVMACHETDDAHCVGWLVNQAGPGNNIGLRLSLFSCENASDVRTIGEQHRDLIDPNSFAGYGVSVNGSVQDLSSGMGRDAQIMATRGANTVRVKAIKCTRKFFRYQYPGVHFLENGRQNGTYQFPEEDE